MQGAARMMIRFRASKYCGNYLVLPSPEPVRYYISIVARVTLTNKDGPPPGTITSKSITTPIRKDN